MAEFKRNTQKYTPTTLPYDIIENILFRLPVKSLLRFRGVCKQWKATISDPKFAEIHLQHSKNSSCKNLIGWNLGAFAPGDLRQLHVVELETDKFRMLPTIQYPPEIRVHALMLCCGDGLMLQHGSLDDKRYVLWNPSIRRYKEFRCPYPIDDSRRYRTLYGICYDPLMKDYKVVISDLKHYAVFHCRNNRWSEMQEMEGFSWSDVKVHESKGFSFHGSCYWVVKSMTIEEVYYGIVIFDSQDEKFKKLSGPNCNQAIDLFDLTSSRGYVCLFLSRLSSWKEEITIMKKVGDDEDSWMEFKVHLPFPSPQVVTSLCLTNGNEIMFHFNGRRSYVLYNQSKNTFAEIPMHPTRRYHYPVPYVENLFLL